MTVSVAVIDPGRFLIKIEGEHFLHSDLMFWLDIEDVSGGSRSRVDFHDDLFDAVSGCDSGRLMPRRQPMIARAGALNITL